MTGRSHAWAAAAVIVTWVGLLTGESGQVPQPTFNGKPLSFWLHQYESCRASIEPAKVAAKREAADAVRAVGTNAFPSLLEMVAMGASWPNGRPKANIDAMMGFEILGPSASNAVPALIEIFENGRSQSAQATAALSLEGVGRGATAAVPVLLRAAAESDSRIRSFAFSILTQIPASRKDVIPIAIRALDDTNLLVDLTVMNFLCGCGSAAANAVPALVDLSTNRIWQLRNSACGTLGNIRSVPNKAVPALVARLADPAPFVRKAAAWALGNFGGSAKEAVPALQHLLNDTNPDVRLAAAEAMKKIIGGNADDAQSYSRRPLRKSKSEEK